MIRTWLIDGMFGTMEADVRTVESDAKQELNSGTRAPLLLRARFNPQLGLPESYFRADWQRNLETSWKITRFEPRSMNPTAD